MLLVLDLATKTGYAAGDPLAHACITALEAAGRPSDMPTCGTYRIAQAGVAVGPFLVKYERWLNKMFERHAPTIVCYEAPYIDRRKTSQAMARKLFSLAGMTDWYCAKRNIRHFQVEATDWRLHFCLQGTGKRALVKRLAIEACRARGWDTDDEDIADALGIFDYCCHILQLNERNHPQ